MQENNSTSNKIYFYVFVTGAATLIIEITATRILSPFFGTTLYTLSSILTIVLSALSLGYYLGGKLADRYHSPTLLYRLILFSGLANISLYNLGKITIPLLAEITTLYSGPILSSLLFFPPVLFLGMISPIAIRLSTKKLSKVGETSGKVYFWGTIGSIIGSLLTGFVLIPHLQISQIINGTSLILIVLSFTGFDKSIFRKNWLWAIVFVSLSTNFLYLLIKKPNNLVFESDSMYQHIKVLKREFDEGEGLLLELDQAKSGAIYIDSYKLPFEYTRYYQLYKLINPRAKTFLFLGGGAFSTSNHLLNTRDDDILVDVIEIDPMLPTIAYKYFHLTPDKRRQIIINDARTYLSKSHSKYDVIFIDAFSNGINIPSHLITSEFFSAINNHLNNHGVVVMNIITNMNPTTPSLGLSTIKTFRQTFPNSEIFALKPDSLQKPQNMMFLGIKGEYDTSILFSHSSNLSGDIQLDINELIQNRLNLSSINLTPHKIFTDDYAPVEYLTAKMINLQNPAL